VIVVTTLLIAVIIRRPCAGAHYGMLDKAIEADVVFARPTAQTIIVGQKLFQHQSLRKEQEGGFQLH
jgi:acetyl-CoA carboxylase carboxyltransferase component